MHQGATMMVTVIPTRQESGGLSHCLPARKGRERRESSSQRATLLLVLVALKNSPLVANNAAKGHRIEDGGRACYEDKHASPSPPTLTVDRWAPASSSSSAASKDKTLSTAPSSLGFRAWEPHSPASSCRHAAKSRKTEGATHTRIFQEE